MQNKVTTVVKLFVWWNRIWITIALLWKLKLRMCHFLQFIVIYQNKDKQSSPSEGKNYSLYTHVYDVMITVIVVFIFVCLFLLLLLLCCCYCFVFVCLVGCCYFYLVIIWTFTNKLELIRCTQKHADIREVTPNIDWCLEGAEERVTSLATSVLTSRYILYMPVWQRTSSVRSDSTCQWQLALAQL